MLSPLSYAAAQALLRVRTLSRALLQARSPFGLAPFSVEGSEAIAEAMDELILARLKERDEQWISFLRQALAENGIEVLLPPTT